jgi:4-carboxymuconolactone decarboxylase
MKVFTVLLAMGMTMLSAAQSNNLPPGVDPISRSRLPRLARADMKDDESRRIYDVISGPNGVPPSGTIAVALYSPPTAEPIRAMNAYLRTKSSLGNRLSELLILVTSRELNQKYEWSAHEPAALRAGLEANVIDVVRNNKPVTGLSERDAVIIRFGRQLFREKTVDPAVFAKAMSFWGRRGTYDVIMLMGHYAMAGVMKHAANQQPPADWNPANLPTLPGMGAPTGEIGKFIGPPVRVTTVPSDVHADTLFRFPYVKREDLDEKGKEMLDRMIGKDRNDAGGGPIGMAFNSPELVDPIRSLNAYLRDKGVLGPRLAEIVIATTGREMNSQYQWAVHSASALRTGASASLLDAIKNDRELTGSDPKDSLVVTFVRELFRTNSVQPETWAKTVEVFGKQGAVEIAELAGDYLMITLMYDALDMQFPRNQEPTLPRRMGAPEGV